MMIEEINYENEIMQVNGQRIYGPPRGWKGGPPPKGSEIFISGLPRNIRENGYVPLFATIGEIYCSRLMVDFSGNNRGFAYVQYGTTEEANLAIKQLDGYEIRTRKKLHVTKSLNNCRLFIGNLPKKLSKEQLEKILRNYTDDVRQVFFYYSLSDKTLNRGFCFVEYENHRAACLARRRFYTTGIPELPNIAIDWAKPEKEVDENIMQCVSVMYLRNLTLKTSEKDLNVALSKLFKPSIVLRIRKVRDFAFVHFANRNATSKAIEAFNGMILDGAEIYATWAKPSYALEEVKKNNFKKGKKKSRDYKQNNVTPNSDFSANSLDFCRIPNSSTPVKYGFVPTFDSSLKIDQRVLSPDAAVERRYALKLNQDSTADIIKHVTSVYFSTLPPVLALQKVFDYFDWGRVQVKIDILPSNNLQLSPYRIKIEIHHNDGCLMTYMCSILSNSMETAKNLAIECFVSSFVLK